MADTGKICLCVGRCRICDVGILTFGVLALVSLPDLKHDALKCRGNAVTDIKSAAHPQSISDSLASCGVRTESVGMRASRYRVRVLPRPFLTVYDHLTSSRRGQGILNDPAEQALASDSDLAVDAGHAPSRLVGGIHQGVVEADPAIERVAAVHLLEFGEGVSLVRAVSEFGAVVGANADGVYDVRQVLSVLFFLIHGIMVSGEVVFLNSSLSANAWVERRAESPSVSNPLLGIYFPAQPLRDPICVGTASHLGCPVLQGIP